MRCAMISGRSAFTSKFAACFTAAMSPGRRRGQGEFRDARRLALDRIGLQLGVANDEHRPHGRRHGDVIGADG